MNFVVDHNSPVPLHYQVEQLLRTLIKEKDYRNGRFLPKEVDLANRLGVCRNTVRQAINKLVFEGLIERKKGTGTKVADNVLTTRLDNWASFTQEMSAKNIPFKNLNIATGRVKADQELAGIFGISPGREIVKLERLRGIHNEPIVFFVSYFHPRLNIDVNDNFSGSLYELLEDKYSLRPAVSKEEIAVHYADEALASKLEIDTGKPLLYRKRLVLDPGRRILEYNLGWYRSDRFTYAIEIKREPQLGTL
jgi:GntR family transcriptional regulator